MNAIISRGDKTAHVQLPVERKQLAGALAEPGDSIDLAYPNLNTRRGRVGKQIAHTITPNITQGVYFIDMNPEPKITELARCITARQDAGISNRRGEHSGVLEKAEEGPRAVLTPDRESIRQQGRRMKDPEEPMFTLTTQLHQEQCITQNLFCVGLIEGAASATPFFLLIMDKFAILWYNIRNTAIPKIATQ